jgi:succinate dehydrogenase/fumarate reductase flavoprotein subunit
MKEQNLTTKEKVGKSAKKELTRRDFLMAAGATTVAAGISAGLAGCVSSNPPTQETLEPVTEYPYQFTAEDYANSSVEVEPITDIAEEVTYDIVVVGAGTSGLPAVLTALDEGATVGVLQKFGTAVAYGNGSGGLLLDQTSPEAVLNWIEGYRVSCNYRCNMGLVRSYAEISGEAICYILKYADQAGYLPASSSLQKKSFDDGTESVYLMNSYGTKPENHGDLIRALVPVAEEKGATFYFSTPAVQLTFDGTRVSGVIGKREDGTYIKLNANKGVILASGDYQNNLSMTKRLIPDFDRFARKQMGSTGDGILMAASVGGDLVPVIHPRTAHDVDSGPMAGMARTEPFLAVNENGERFMNEDVFMAYWGQELRYQDASDPGKFCNIFDDDYEGYVKEWGGSPTKHEDMLKWIPGEVADPKGVYANLIDTHKADTLDDLAKELNIPADKLKASVERYNELCAKGHDDDFGKPVKYMKPIKTAPFWGIHRWVRVSAIHGGIAINKDFQVIDANGAAIPGLYGAGFGAGDFCGAGDWIVYAGGLSAGYCMVSGRGAAAHAVNGDIHPTKNLTAYADIEAIREKV